MFTMFMSEETARKKIQQFKNENTKGSCSRIFKIFKKFPALLPNTLQAYQEIATDNAVKHAMKMCSLDETLEDRVLQTLKAIGTPSAIKGIVEIAAPADIPSLLKDIKTNESISAMVDLTHEYIVIDDIAELDGSNRDKIPSADVLQTLVDLFNNSSETDAHMLDKKYLKNKIEEIAHQVVQLDGVIIGMYYGKIEEIANIKSILEKTDPIVPGILGLYNNAVLNYTNTVDEHRKACAKIFPQHNITNEEAPKSRAS